MEHSARNCTDIIRYETGERRNRNGRGTIAGGVSSGGQRLPAEGFGKAGTTGSENGYGGGKWTAGTNADGRRTAGGFGEKRSSQDDL